MSANLQWDPEVNAALRDPKVMRTLNNLDMTAHDYLAGDSGSGAFPALANNHDAAQRELIRYGNYTGKYSERPPRDI